LSEFAGGLQCVLDRGGAVMATYSGSSLRLMNDVRELDRILRPFGLAGRVSCRIWPEANHTFTELSAQAQLLDTIVAWAAELSGRSGVGDSGARPARASGVVN
jgi:hypothetical protein